MKVKKITVTKTVVVAKPTMVVVMRIMGILFSKILIGISYFHFSRVKLENKNKSTNYLFVLVSVILFLK